MREANQTLRNIRWVYIKEFTADVENGKITNYCINAKVSFDLERAR
jgi:flavin-binding protein dodecin